MSAHEHARIDALASAMQTVQRCGDAAVTNNHLSKARAHVFQRMGSNARVPLHAIQANACGAMHVLQTMNADACIATHAFQRIYALTHVFQRMYIMWACSVPSARRQVSWSLRWRLLRMPAGGLRAWHEP